ncbi:MAG: type III pantothenate kinase [Candidatus Omnitrophica bacterium]|nr:type III pantothenate kinase [Candidatus Omnitrophota bacterium]MBU4477687.1 type III pantothenate kinase [Candidatus Omnitrophota bacterium]MCG2703884.1 type III pantothenate kinase [Candidatus Omnitrophota bacterium]
MVIFIDVGNTNTTFAVNKGGDCYRSWDIPTKLIASVENFRRKLLSAARKAGVDACLVRAVVICSVVPKAEPQLKKNIKSVFPAAKEYMFGKDIPVPIKNKYHYPQQVGSDRLANALGVRYCYSCPALVVDAGTAITIDVISAKAEYLGGIIAPGIGMSLSGLHEKTALLPKLTAGRPSDILGKDTRASMLSGVFYGFSFMIDGLVKSLKNRLKGKIVVVGTGGMIDYLQDFCKEIDVYDPFLTIKGIEIACKLAKNKEKQQSYP